MSARNLFIAAVAALLLPALRAGAQVFEPTPEPPHAHNPDTWQEMLDCTDEDWTVIEPRIEKVLALHARPYGPAVRRMAELRDLTDRGARPDIILDKLQALRQARAEAERYIAQAEADLRQVLTVRQEATLVAVGVLE